MEARHELRQIGDLDPLRDDGTDESAAGAAGPHLRQHFGRGSHQPQGGGDAAGHADLQKQPRHSQKKRGRGNAYDPQAVAQAARRLRAESPQGAHAAEGGGQVRGLVHLRDVLHRREAVGGHEDGRGDPVQVVVFRRIVGSLKGKSNLSVSKNV